MKDHTEIIVLGAGKGTRMEAEVPKVLVPFKGRPMIDHVLDTVKASGCLDPIIVVGFGADMVCENCGPHCRYVVQDKQQGTGHAVLVVEPSLRAGTTSVLVVYGDQPLVTPNTMNEMLLPLEVGVKLVLATAIILDDHLFEQQFSRFGRIVRNEEGKIVKIVEAKDASDDELAIREVNVGFMAFNRDWAFDHLKHLKNNNAQGEYYLTDLVSIAFGEGLEIDSVQLNEREALGANTKEQLALMEELTELFEE